MSTSMAVVRPVHGATRRASSARSNRGEGTQFPTELCRTAGALPTVISCLGAFRTPAAIARG
jgi:hypothetical protein